MPLPNIAVDVTHVREAGGERNRFYCKLAAKGVLEKRETNVGAAE